MGRLFVSAAIAWALFAPGCTYELSLDGKLCDEIDAPCPPGYTCVPEAGQSVCRRRADDGGTADGADGTDGGDEGQCQEDDTRCAEDLSATERCQGGAWVATACGSGSYCFDAEQGGPTCVAECDNSAACAADRWCNPDTAHCEPKGDCQNPGQARCNSSLDEVVSCSAESGYDVVIATCTTDEYCDPFDPACKGYCDDDRDCSQWADTSCDLSSRKCVAMAGCSSDTDCAEAEVCVEASACVPSPTQEARDVTGGASPLDCYVTEPAPGPVSPPTCNIEGRVVNFFSRQELSDAIGLTVRIHAQADVLLGRLDNPIAETTAFDDGGVGQYSLSGLPTNTDLVLEVAGRPEAADPPPFGYATMYTFGIHLRADDCSAGTISLAAPSIYQTNYDGYSSPPGVVASATRGLVLGVVRDCSDGKISNATIGTSLPHERQYFISHSGTPDMAADATSSSGFFALANVTPIQGRVNVLALSSAVSISLWTHPVRVFPQAASLVLIEQPQAPRD